MFKIIVYIFLIGLSFDIYAGRGVYLVIDNSSFNLIRLSHLSSNCVDGMSRLKNLSIPPATAKKIYLEADNGGTCIFQSSDGKFAIDVLSSNPNTLQLKFTISNNDSDISLSKGLSKIINDKAYAINQLNRSSGSDLLIVKITPQQLDQISTSSWMGNLATVIADKKINQLLIPGTHDSFSADFTDAKYFCNADPEVSEWMKIGASLSSKTVLSYARAQYLSFSQQLYAGIRYFDTRLCYQNQQSFVSHSLLSSIPFSDHLIELKNFLNLHPKEIIILDLNHVYGFDVLNMSQLLIQIKTIFGDRLAGFQNFSSHSLVKDFWQQNKNLIVILPSEFNQLSTQYDFAWPANTIKSPWPNTTSISSLLKLSGTNLNQRSNDSLFVSQMIISPDSDYVIKNPASGLDRIANENLFQVESWRWDNQSKPWNIFIDDSTTGFTMSYFAIVTNNNL